MRHRLRPFRGGVRCVNCAWRWSLGTATEPCPGTRRYGWNDGRHGLLTREELRQRRLQPGSPAAGAIWLGRANGWLRLFSVAQAKPGPGRPQRCHRCGQELRLARDTFEWPTCGVCERAADEDVAHQRDLRDYDRWRRDRATAILWAQRMLASPDLVVFDSETTSLDGEFVQAAVIDRDGVPLINTLIQPTCSISAEAYAIHRISAAMLIDAPGFPAIHEAISQVLTQKTVVGYNIDFDRRILEHSCHLHHLTRPHAGHWECAMEHYARFAGNWSRRHWSYTFLKLPGGTHDALGDCMATLDLLKQMAAATLDADIEEQEVHVAVLAASDGGDEDFPF